MYVLKNEPREAAKYSEARRLRLTGMSINRIAVLVGAAQSTVSYWVRDIELRSDQIEELRRRSTRSRNEAWQETSRERRRAHQLEGRIMAREGQVLHVAGCMRYWAEGAKCRNTVHLANSDPAMMVLFVRFLRECFDVTAADIRFNLNVYTDNGRTIDEIESYWIDLLSLSRNCARKHICNHFPTSSSGKRRNKLPYGVCSLKVKRSTWLVQHIYGAIQEYSGIDQPDWLDGPERRKPAA